MHNAMASEGLREEKRGEERSRGAEKQSRAKKEREESGCSMLTGLPSRRNGHAQEGHLGGAPKPGRRSGETQPCTHTHTPKDTHTHTRTLTTLTANGAWLGKGGGRGRGGRDEGLKEEVAMIYAVVVSSIIDAMVATSRCFESANSPRIDGTIY